MLWEVKVILVMWTRWDGVDSFFFVRGRSGIDRFMALLLIEVSEAAGSGLETAIVDLIEGVVVIAI